MSAKMEATGLQLRSLVTEHGEIELSLISEPVPQPAADEVVIRIEAAPLNPSDIGLLFGAADMSTATHSGTATRPVVTANIPPIALPSMVSRVGQSLPVGNEGAGVVILAGAAASAQALLGQNVAALGGAMFAQYRCIKATDCLVLPADTTPLDGASALVNPLTVLGMIATMRSEGHTALVHTAGASALGQMLNRLCLKDGIGLVSIVRKAEQAALLRSQGATYVCDSSTPTFTQDLTAALGATHATVAFDATGGGKLASQILTGMETVLSRRMQAYSRYGSTTHKQVYIYGGLDPSPLELTRSFGMSWGVGGWILFQVIQKLGAAEVQAMKQRIAAELKTTFATSYAKQVSLTEALDLQEIAAYFKRGTGGKYVINPNKDVLK